MGLNKTKRQVARMRYGTHWFWFERRLLCTIFQAQSDSQTLEDIATLNCFAEEMQVFDDRKTHFTPGSGAIFVRSMLDAAEAFFAYDPKNDDQGNDLLKQGIIQSMTLNTKEYRTRDWEWEDHWSKG